MKKDVIYIDNNDDITDIIRKINDSKTRIIAIVPPKRTGVLGSVVNLKLVKKTVDETNKRMVLVTEDEQLLRLSGGVGIYTASHLQDKPVIPTAAQAENNESDVIEQPETEAETPAVIPPKTAATKDKKKGIPDFNTFRKRLLIGGVLGILLLVGLVWALVFAPKATIALIAETDTIAFDEALTLDINATQYDADTQTVPAQSLEATKKKSAEVTATGEKNVGDLAAGTVEIANCSDSKPVSFVTNTALVGSDSNVYFTTESVTVPGADFSGGSCDTPGTATVAVRAENPGKAYNKSSGTLSFRALSASANSLYTITIQSITGGTDNIQKIITQQDIDAAITALVEGDNRDDKAALAQSAKKEVVLVEGSFTERHTDPIPTPAVGEPAEKGTVESTFSFTQLAVSQETIKEIIDAAISKNITASQEVLDYNLDSLNFKTSGKKATLSGAVTVGPDLATGEVADRVKGKSFKDAIDEAESIDGVNKANINLSPFWVTSVPKSAKKITVTVQVTGANSADEAPKE